MRLADLSPASFRGVKFLVPRDSAEEGRNSIPHHYPDSAHRYVEDNGYCPPEFSLTCVLAGDGLPGKFSALRRALNTPGPGTLRHPWYGSRLCAVMGPWRVQRDDTDCGVLVLEIKFAVTGGAVLPGLLSGVAALVSGLAGSVTGSVFAGMASRLAVPSGDTTRQAIASAIADLGGVLAAPFASSGVAVRQLVTESVRLALAPASLSATLIKAFREPIADTRIPAAALVRGFTASAALAKQQRQAAAAIAPTTLDRANRRTLLAEIAEAAHVASLAALADSMAGRTYEVADQVSVDEATLLAVYGNIQSVPLDSELSQTVLRMVLEAAEVLQRQQVRLPRLADLDVYETPASVLAYSLYESDARTLPLCLLNPTQSPVLFDGVCDIFEAV